MLWKYCIYYASKFGKLSSGYRTGKGQFSFQSQRKAMPKNVLTAAQLHLFYMLAKKWPGFYIMWTVNFQMFSLDLEKVEEPEIKLPTPVGSSKKQESSKKRLILLYWLCQSLWLCGSQQTVENSSRDGNTKPPYLPSEKSVCRSRSNSYNQTWNNRMVPNWERSTSRLYVVTLLI